MSEVELRRRPLPRLPMRPLVRRVSRLTGFSVAEILGRRRHHELVLARKAVVLVALDLSERSTPEIGQGLAGRDHSTVINLREGGIERYRRDPAFRELVRTLRAETLADPWGGKFDRVAATVDSVRRGSHAERRRRTLAEIEHRRKEAAEWRELLRPERCISASDFNGASLMTPEELAERRGEGERRQAAHIEYWLSRERPPIGRQEAREMA